MYLHSFLSLWAPFDHLHYYRLISQAVDRWTQARKQERWMIDDDIMPSDTGKRCYLSRKIAKHDQTPVTSSESLELLSQVPPPFVATSSSRSWDYLTVCCASANHPTSN